MDNVSKRRIFDSIVWAVSLLFVFGLLISEAWAESIRSPATNKTWAAECGSCHLAFPPDMLPAPAWRRMMSGLDRHFGTDASVDTRAAAEIGAFLERNAGRGRKRGGDSGTLRITETRWFVRKHDEVSPAVWKNPRVKTPANCGACHAGAERGNFDDDDVRVSR